MFSKPTTINSENYKEGRKGLFTSLLLICAITVAFSSVTKAQRTVVVEPDDFPSQVGSLNIAIESDTTSSGDRVDENTIYILKRDGVYWLDGTISNQGYHLRIEAEDGDGHPPVIRPAVDLTGSSSQLFQTYGDLTLRGLYLNHITDQGGLEKNVIRSSGEDSRIIVDNCWFEFEEQSWIRVDNSNQSIFVTNTQGRNNGRNDGGGNGRILDTRGIEVDTLLIENSTFYNHQGNGLRTGGGVVKYLKMNHNTFVDIKGSFEFGKALKVDFTNNLWTNIGFDGIAYSNEERTDVGIFQFASVNEIEGLSDEDREINISNNNFERSIDELIDDEYGALFGPYRTELQSILDSHPDSVVNNRKFIDSTGLALQVLGVLTLSNNIIEDESGLEYTDRPDFQTIVDFMDHKYNHPEDVDNYPLMWDNPDSRVEGSSLDDWRDFSYSTSAESYTAADGGFPLGDLNWFPDMMELWTSGATVANEEDELITGFTLNQNYPNPFNPSTNISFTLPEASQVQLKVYNLLGQEVAVLLNSRLTAGSHSVTFEASGLSSGMYLYRIESGSFIQQKKMMLIK